MTSQDISLPLLHPWEKVLSISHPQFLPMRNENAEWLYGLYKIIHTKRPHRDAFNKYFNYLKSHSGSEKIKFWPRAQGLCFPPSCHEWIRNYLSPRCSKYLSRAFCLTVQSTRPSISQHHHPTQFCSHSPPPVLAYLLETGHTRPTTLCS